MYHRVEFVAKAQCVPEKELVEFASVNHQKIWNRRLSRRQGSYGQHVVLR
jgi:hypothetical protein